MFFMYISSSVNEQRILASFSFASVTLNQTSFNEMRKKYYIPTGRQVMDVKGEH